MRHDVLNKIKIIKRQANLMNLAITDDEIKEIIQKIKSLQPDLTSINLDGNQLSDKGAIILANCLRHDFPQLKELSLQFNNIDKDGAFSLFSLKKDLVELSILFHGNKIIDQGQMYEIERLSKGM